LNGRGFLPLTGERRKMTIEQMIEERLNMIKKLQKEVKALRIVLAEKLEKERE